MCGCVGTQIAAAGVLILITFVFGFLPLMLKNCLVKSGKITKSKIDNIVSTSLVFGAGILFATAVLHMLFETREGFAKLKHSGFITAEKYPLSELIFCSGFLFIYAFEEIILYNFLKGSAAAPHSHCQRDVVYDSETQRLGIGSEPGVSKADVESKLSFLRTIIFMFAIYLHTIFEGLAVGIAETPNEVWILTGAIAAHKIFIAFSSGNEVMGQSKQVYYVSIFLLALMPTLGTVVGVILSGELHASETGDFILNFLTGFSGGVILFVVFCEILEKERAKNTGRIRNMVAFTIGFACMAAILIIPEKRFEDMITHTTNSPVEGSGLNFTTPAINT